MHSHKSAMKWLCRLAYVSLYACYVTTKSVNAGNATVGRRMHHLKRAGAIVKRLERFVFFFGMRILL